MFMLFIIKYLVIKLQALERRYTNYATAAIFSLSNCGCRHTHSHIGFDHQQINKLSPSTCAHVQVLAI